MNAQPTAGEFRIVNVVACPECGAKRGTKCYYLTGPRKGSQMHRVHPARRFHAQVPNA